MPSAKCHVRALLFNKTENLSIFNNANQLKEKRKKRKKQEILAIQS